MSTQPLRLAGAALLVIFGIWAGAWVYLHHSHAPAAVGIPVAAGHASAPNPSDFDSPSAGALPIAEIPDRLPPFSLADRTGKATPITAFAGKSLVINFWATWCAPCRSEIPLLQALNNEWAGRDVSVIGIAVDHRDKVLEYAERLKIGYPLLIGEQDALDVAATFGVDSPVFPFTVFTDRRGEVVTLFVGELHRPQAELILAAVHNLDKGLIELPAARQAIVDGLQALKPKPGPLGVSLLRRDFYLPATFAAKACLFSSISGYYRGPLQCDGAGLKARWPEFCS
jgi:thiol-disulfide isomerase/thioredoxin